MWTTTKKKRKKKGVHERHKTEMPNLTPFASLMMMMMMMNGKLHKRK
jgi:hypothetical protein